MVPRSGERTVGVNRKMRKMAICGEDSVKVRGPTIMGVVNTTAARPGLKRGEAN